MNYDKNIVNNLRAFLNTSSFNAKVVNGGFWLTIGSGSENILRLIRNMILTRILLPDAFGSMAIILAVNFFFESFTQIGIKESIIQNPKGNEKTYLNGAFCLSSVRGLILFVVGILLAPLIANFYNNPDIIPLMRVSFLGILFLGVMSPRSYSELKAMNYKKWIFLYNGGGLIGVLTTIILCLMFHSLWSLVIGYTVESFARTILSYIFCPFIPRFEFEKESMESLFQFARRMTGLPILVFLYNKIDIFVLGKMVSISDLEMYSMVKVLAYTPMLLVDNIFNPILLPVFSTIQNNTIILSKRVTQFTKYIVLIFFPLLTIMACYAKLILYFVYGQKYAASSVVFVIFCLSIALTILGTVIVNALIAIGKPHFTREASLTRLIVMSILIIPLIKQMNVNGAALASLISSIMWFFFLLLKTKRHIGISLYRYFICFFEGIGISLIIIVFKIFYCKFF